MRFDYDFTIPADTSSLTPERLDARLLKGTLTSISVEFKPGCAHMVLVAIREQLTQIAPANPGGSFNGDGATLTFPMNWPIQDEPFELQVYAWSPGTNFPHTLLIRFDVDPSEKNDKSAILEALARLLNMDRVIS
jgi:hypothetical protein